MTVTRERMKEIENSIISYRKDVGVGNWEEECKERVSELSFVIIRVQLT